MPNLWVVFLTGLTTGGLSCLAVQGGLLANVIGRQTEEELEPATEPSKPDLIQMSKHDLINYYKGQNSRPKVNKSFRGDMTLSIVLFLAAKIVAYTLLGFGLGWLGTMIQLTPIARGVLMLFIAIFMIGTALRMFNVHPIFNYFQINPPKFIRVFIRRYSKNSKEDFATPIFLGTLTVLIPCGITQAMMALAIGTGSPAAGALIMFAFTLGASPVFFLLAYFTARLGEKMNLQFVRVVAVLILVFGLYALESGLNLVGSPVSFARAKQAIGGSGEPIATTVEEPKPNQPTTSPLPTEQTITINALDGGYKPNFIRAKADVSTKISLMTKDTYSCSRAFTIPSQNIQIILPATGTEIITLAPQPKGRMRFSCSMGMYTGEIVFN